MMAVHAVLLWGELVEQGVVGSRELQTQHMRCVGSFLPVACRAPLVPVFKKERSAARCTRITVHYSDSVRHVDFVCAAGAGDHHAQEQAHQHEQLGGSHTQPRSGQVRSLGCADGRSGVQGAAAVALLTQPL